MDPVSVTRPSLDLDLLYPPFRDLVVRGLAAVHAAGIEAEVFEALRAPERQAWLYAQGRTRPGPIVTRATVGQSWHEYGLAVDIVFAPGGQWSWTGPWAAMAAYFTALGLQWYGSPTAAFHEFPHFQLTYGLSLQRAHYLKSVGGLAALWREIDQLTKGVTA